MPPGELLQDMLTGLLADPSRERSIGRKPKYSLRDLIH
jgi:hypothetical protein